MHGPLIHKDYVFFGGKIAIGSKLCICSQMGCGRRLKATWQTRVLKNVLSSFSNIINEEVTPLIYLSLQGENNESKVETR